jgi:hypothetical protein
MADYYPVLARAVASLPHNDAQARTELYARARTIVAEQLRQRDLQDPVWEMWREQASLDAAIRRVEAESRSGHISANGKPVTLPPQQRVTTADPPERAKTTAKSLTKILQAVQSDETSEPDPQISSRKSMNGTHVLAPSADSIPVPSAESTAVATGVDSETATATELGGAPASLGALLFGLAYAVAALTFAGVTYVRCIVWVYQGVIGYPTLLAVMAVTLALFILPPVAFFFRSSSLPTIDMVARFIYSASRRVL